MYNGHLINGDHSASDLALCNHLAFWTGNSATRIDAMFRESGLMRDKWDVIHFRDTNETYGERTIATAISSTSTTILDNKEQFAEFSFDFLKGDAAEVVEEKPKKKFRLTELGNAERIAYEYGHVIKYVSDMGWLIWDGKRWKIDTKKEIERITAKFLRNLSQRMKQKLNGPECAREETYV